MYRLPLTCLLLTLAFSPLSNAATSPPPSRPLPASTSSSLSLATLLPAISSALHDLSATHSDDVSYLTLAKRNLRFTLSSLIGPLQLLDWSHWSTDPFSSVIHYNTRTADEEWLGEDEEFAAHGDPSHVLRTTVNAHKQAVAAHTPHRSHHLSESSSIDSLSVYPPPASIAALALNSTVASIASADIPLTLASPPTTFNIDEPDDTCASNGIPVRFTRLNNRTHRYEDTSLCYCPADFTAATCGVRQPYRCQLHLTTDTNNACTTARSTAVPTDYSAHSERLPLVHLSSSGSEFYTYEPVLSGPPPPCLILTTERPLLEVNFTCHFVDVHGAATTAEEGFDRARLAYRLSLGYRLNDTLPVPSYAVKNVDATTGGVTFAVSGNIGLSVSTRLHNTAHPSQYRQTAHALTAAQLQFDADNRTVPLAVLSDVGMMDPNLRRGGRLLMELKWQGVTNGLVVAGSGLPWQLTVEDGTWVLPGPTKRVLLTKWQTAGVVVLVVVVVLLLVWRWYQRRQRAAMQALLAEQRDKQQSWFEHTE